jgi:hypothetical protein
MILRQLLTCVFHSCIYMSYASRYCRTKGATAQSCPHTASAWLVAFPSCSATLEGIFSLLSSGVSVYRAGAAANKTCSRQPSQDRFYCQTAILAGPAAPPPCCSHAAYVERHRQSRSDRGARSRTEAWLTCGQPGCRARFSGNISSTVYSIRSSSRPMKPWSPTSDGPHTNPRR